MARFFVELPEETLPCGLRLVGLANLEKAGRRPFEHRTQPGLSVQHSPRPPPGRDDLLVRTSPVIGQKAWFGPRRVGWGLGPVSPEGWVLTALFSGISLLARRKKVGRGPRWLLFGLMATVIVLKGTSPGGPAARVAFDHERAQASAASGPDGASAGSGPAQASAGSGSDGGTSSAE